MILKGSNTTDTLGRKLTRAHNPKASVFDELGVSLKYQLSSKLNL